MGYDVSDYYAIYPPYGTLKDVDRLIQGLHATDMKYVMDLVVNHTSDQVSVYMRMHLLTSISNRDCSMNGSNSRGFRKLMSSATGISG